MKGNRFSRSDKAKAKSTPANRRKFVRDASAAGLLAAWSKPSSLQARELCGLTL